MHELNFFFLSLFLFWSFEFEVPRGWLGVFEFYVFDLHDGRSSLAHSLTIEVPRGRFEVPRGRFSFPNSPSRCGCGEKANFD